MEIGAALDRIKSNICRNSIRFSMHAKEKLNDRNLTKEAVIEALRKGEILGIVEQDDAGNMYKLWLSHKNDMDLNVILKIENDGLFLITAFVCESGRRKKDGKS
jgi:hypothetical protein